MLPFDPMDAGVRLAVAAMGGLAVGIEREWSSRVSSRGARFAGVRTFFLLGLIGGLSAELVQTGFVVTGGAVFVAAAAITVGAYVVAGLRSDVEGTTEVAAVVVLAAGFLAGIGRLGLAAGIFAITALALVEKSRIHSLVYRIPSQTLEAAARFAVLALVVLPILPAGPFGPAPGFRPRELWALVLLFSGLSFAGFVAMHAAGAQKGYRVAGLLGGLVSSTAVTLGFSRESRSGEVPGGPLAVGVVGACTVLLLRTETILVLLHPGLALETGRYLVIPFVGGTLWTLFGASRSEAAAGEPEMPRNPLRLVSAIQMAIAFQVVLFVVHAAGERFGSPGTLVSAALLGFTDVDALTYSILRLGEAGTIEVAARALTIGILSNTVLKLAIALVVGRGAFRRLAAPGLAALAAATATALAVVT